MEIQQKDDETLAAYIYHFKRAAKWCAFDNDTMAICIFVKGLRDAPTITPKMYEKEPQTLAEVIILVELLSAAHQLTATLTPSAFSRMSGDYRCFVCGWTGHFGCHYPDAQCYGCDELGNFAQDCPTRFLHQECHTTMVVLIQGIYIPITRGIGSHSYYGSRHRWHLSRSQSCPHSHCARSSNFRRHTSCSPSNHCSNLCYPSVYECFHHPLCCDTNRHSCTPFPYSLLLQQLPLTPLQRLQPVLLQQFPLQSTGISAQKSQGMLQTLNTP